MKALLPKASILFSVAFMQIFILHSQKSQMYYVCLFIALFILDVSQGALMMYGIV